MSEDYDPDVLALIEERIGDRERAVAMAVEIHALVARMPRLPDETRLLIAEVLAPAGDAGCACETRAGLRRMRLRAESDRQHTSGPNDPTHETDEG